VTQLVSHYEDKPLDLKGKVELAQHSMASAAQFRSRDGAVRPGVADVVVLSPVARSLSALRWPDEPGFAAAVVSVLENKATHVAITIRCSNRFSLGGGLGVRLQKVGFDVSGGHDNTGVASLQITAQFPTPPKNGWL
jgi:hypothetical protein